MKLLLPNYPRFTLSVTQNLHIGQSLTVQFNHFFVEDLLLVTIFLGRNQRVIIQNISYSRV